MGDLVDRQTAIDRLALLDFVSTDGKVFVDAVLDMLEKLPSAEKTGGWVEVGGYFTPGGDPVWKCPECGKGMHVYGIEHQSYQRDIADGQWVACPNCGTKMTTMGCKTSDLVDRQTAIERLTLLEFVSPDDKVYVDAVFDMLEKLPSAEKTGKWIKASGYASPGGDPVWKCSDCGKGTHVYGIEHQSYQGDIADGQWVACPNCGVKMKND